MSHIYRVCIITMYQHHNEVSSSPSSCIIMYHHHSIYMYHHCVHIIHIIKAPHIVRCICYFSVAFCTLLGTGVFYDVAMIPSFPVYWDAFISGIVGYVFVTIGMGVVCWTEVALSGSTPSSCENYKSG